jgi:hypothetical protein
LTGLRARAQVNMASVAPPTERELRWPDASRLWRAFMLAPSLEVCAALLRGETVPVDRLDPAWVARFGRRSL